MRSVAAKSKKIRKRSRKSRRIQTFLEKRPIPAVRGPGDAYYIVDRHHFSLALHHCAVTRAFVDVIDDLSNLAPSRFWKEMERFGRLYPFDERGQRVNARTLPCAISELRPDPFRDLAWSVREKKGFKKSRKPFSEFAWADFFRTKIPHALLQKNYDKAVEWAMKLARSDHARGLPGHIKA